MRAQVLSNADTIVVMLHNTLTKGEQTLVNGGHTDEVLRLRRAYQAELEPQYTDAIQRITGRGVVAFMSTNHTDPDHAAEIFILGDPIEAA